VSDLLKLQVKKGGYTLQKIMHIFKNVIICKHKLRSFKLILVQIKTPEMKGMKIVHMKTLFHVLTHGYV
jgi:hypothetical protein